LFYGLMPWIKLWFSYSPRCYFYVFFGVVRLKLKFEPFRLVVEPASLLSLSNFQDHTSAFVPPVFIMIVGLSKEIDS